MGLACYDFDPKTDLNAYFSDYVMKSMDVNCTSANIPPPGQSYADVPWFPAHEYLMSIGNDTYVDNTGPSWIRTKGSFDPNRAALLLISRLEGDRLPSSGMSWRTSFFGASWCSRGLCILAVIISFLQWA